MPVKSLWAAGMLALLAGPALAQDAPPATVEFNVNTLFLILCTILVMWMTAGFTMLEAGFVRAKNVVNQCAKNLGLFAIATTAFFAFGYNLAFPGDGWMITGFLGGFGPADIGRVAPAGTEFTGARPAVIDVLFQMMFAAAVASIVSGALAERMKLIPFFVFTFIFTAFIYPIQAAWVWGGGFLSTALNFKDLAGGTVIHVTGGVAALIGSIVIGARAGRFTEDGKVAMTSYNLPLATLGALILWMGWFGFNAGSYIGFTDAADASNVSRIMLNTNLAAAGGVLGAGLVSYTRFNRFDLSFMMNGALGGLVSITAEPLFPTPMIAATIGMTGGLIVVWAVLLLDQLRIDDVVGAVPVHLFCGAWGTMAVVLSNPEATIMGQAVSLLFITAFVAVASTAAWLGLHAVFGIRVSLESEIVGNDEAEMVMES